jgi:hydroxylamine reductase
MFCYQCEQTAQGTACTATGACGKDAETATLQDLLVHAAKGISMYARRARALGARDREVDLFVVEALFTTVTNVNFNPERLEELLRAAGQIIKKAGSMYTDACAHAEQAPEELGGPALWRPASTRAGLVAQAEDTSIARRIETLGGTVAGLQELLLYGLKGAAAYADHAQVLGREDEGVYAFFHEALDLLAKPEARADELLAYCLKCGEANLKAMELLDAANTSAYGNPVPTPVRVTPRAGKAILVSGHDLKDLEEVLKKTDGTGINVYTHGEMLPAHGYPGLKKFAHLVGNYGGAWQDQRAEFDAFPGAILMTTNCIQKPKESYRARIFTTGLVSFPGVVHVTRRDFSPLIKAARAAAGFAADAPGKTITVGFGHAAVLGVAGAVIDAVKSGAIKHFFLVGGCDGAKSGRNYYTEFVQRTPRDTVVLTLGCGKYRFNKLDLGTIGGLPRLLDIGQCNDAYSAIKIASALAAAFGTDVNGLPLSLVLSWYEQKAVAILLTLLHLGIKNIRLGPSLPAFVTSDALKILVDTFGIKPITTPQADLDAILGTKPVA